MYACKKAHVKSCSGTYAHGRVSRNLPNKSLALIASNFPTLTLFSLQFSILIRIVPVPPKPYPNDNNHFEREGRALLQGTLLLPREQSKLFNASEKVGRILLRSLCKRLCEFGQEKATEKKKKKNNQSLHELSRYICSR